ncbi:unnamed protein product [Schistosoma margrebowiei]|uniref:Uncharacterized protein n=1 Tax=Schistosoma margrebowiei TaxID=48269 RepID=A0A183MG87_9TREM|nr:unnamed protein product [Schistosoma margrebowiei]
MTIRQIKSGKAAGPENIPAEALKSESSNRRIHESIKARPSWKTCKHWTAVRIHDPVSQDSNTGPVGLERERLNSKPLNRLTSINPRN